MKTGIIITARLGSTRLSRKHLREIAGAPILNILIRRIRSEFEVEVEDGSVKIIIATGDDPLNKALEDIPNVCLVFYGSRENIPLRHLQAAKKYNFDNIISVDGDDILCSTAAMRLVLEDLKEGFLISKTSGLPLGMNAMGYQRDILVESVRRANADLLETGWPRIFDLSKIHELCINSYDSDNLRFTLDYDDDLQFFKKIIELLGEKVVSISDARLIDFVVSREIYQLNAHIAKEYWANFNMNLEVEKEKNK